MMTAWAMTDNQDDDGRDSGGGVGNDNYDDKLMMLMFEDMESRRLIQLMGHCFLILMGNDGMEMMVMDL